MDELIDSIGVDFIETDEIVKDLKYHISEYINAPECADGINSTYDLRREGEQIYGKVNRHFDVHYTYSTDNLWYAELDDGIGGLTRLPGWFGPSETEIYVNTKHAGNAAIVDYILAHEATHAALRDGSEWMEELVALDVAYGMLDKGERSGIGKVIHERKIDQTIDALAMKLRKGEGWSEVKIANYMREEIHLTDSLILSYVDVNLKEGDFKKVWWGSRKGEIEETSRYHSKPYFAEKYMKKNGVRFNLSINQYSFQLDLENLFAHTDDSEKSSVKEIDHEREELDSIRSGRVLAI
ncbi:MAG: hypothetical protein QF415_06960 [Candidatus Undinarchaeales archaeon]|jgi:hypothetical protein|nr:hypothetical protein [Candidatus Undinarchaeales archaeon]MDP7491704.1 hypothetical protein [Candidatus Undinarchaeales archaeon]